MFKSIKTTIIVTVMILFLIGISVMTILSMNQVRTSTKDDVEIASHALIDEIGISIENYLTQFEKGLVQLANSPTMEMLLVKRFHAQ